MSDGIVFPRVYYHTRHSLIEVIDKRDVKSYKVPRKVRAALRGSGYLVGGGSELTADDVLAHVPCSPRPARLFD